MGVCSALIVVLLFQSVLLGTTFATSVIVYGGILSRVRSLAHCVFMSNAVETQMLTLVFRHC